MEEIKKERKRGGKLHELGVLSLTEINKNKHKREKLRENADMFWFRSKTE